MPIRPGTLDTFAGSMADTIEMELNAMLLADNLPQVVPDSSRESRDRRRLFVAITRGVVAHLQANAATITIAYFDGGVSKTTSPKLNADMT